MENINTYSDTMNTANLFRNANFSILQEKSDQFIEKQKETGSESSILQIVLLMDL